MLGSRKATRTRHARVGGLHQHHPPASPHSTFDQLALRCTNRGIRSLTRHRGLCQKGRLEVLHRNQFMFVNNSFRPYSRIVLGLPGRLLVQLCGCTRGPLVPAGLWAGLGTPTPGHFPLRSSKLRSGSSAVTEVRQIERGVGRCGSGYHSPIDANAALGVGRSLHSAPDNKRRVPVPERISSHPNACRCGRQLTRPHHWHSDALRQHQLAVLDAESTLGIFQRQLSRPARFKLRPSSALDGERLLVCLGVGPQHLLLRNLRSFSQPRVTRPGFGQEFAQTAKCWPVSRFLLMDSLIPQEPAAVPLGQQCDLGSAARPQAEAVPHHLIHTQNLSRDHRHRKEDGAISTS